ncbi:Serine/threonine-protein kinase PBS1 [Heracleum sosnowskyi]|uniref:Serine/threonine-protein kinase PBS1 n=1 Tax=Heracleum sosnowskyi TaxID=360622 RepID=A0AAD8H678_9APIA|nr:Serine/threonine-protein kinase PBS1 [Heracleum sosnowskyi]
MIESVVFCPCFGRKRGLKLKSHDEEEHDHVNVNVDEIDLPDHHVNVDPRSSSGHEVQQKTNLELDLERSLAENDIKAKSDAQLFTFRELASATKNFRNESIVGEGGFGPVYRGKLEKSGQVVAIKKLNEKGVQGDKEFLVEILMLSLLRHPNLVKMIGYCAEGDQRLLVYEYMPFGSLDSHLHDLEPDMEPPSWNARMRIAYGAAKGLDYLHNDAKPQLTKRSDVYSFGVVLLELITGRRALERTQPRESQMIVQWARPLLRDRRDFVKLADPRLKGQFPRSSVRRAVEVALMCVQDESRARPGIREVVEAIEYLSSHKYEHEHNGSGSYSPRSDGLRTAEREPQTNMKVVESVKSSEDVETEKLNKEQERQRAVAEAKMWGETWREKRQQFVENQFDLSSRVYM